MAKKFTRGITNIKNILLQDFDTNNVNDLLSDEEHNYIHRKKKDKTEEYHCLTDNIKTIKSDNTDLLSVTNYNKTTNTATLHPHHDQFKEQVIESTRNTIDINYGENGTEETTKVDVNPAIVLEHDNLLAEQHLTKEHVDGTNTTILKVSDEFIETVNNKQDKLKGGIDISISGNTINSRAVSQTNIEIDFTNNMNVLSDYKFTKLEFGAGKAYPNNPAIGRLTMKANTLEPSKYGALQGTLAPILNTLLPNHFDSITLTLSASNLSDLAQIVTITLTTENVNLFLGTLANWFNTNSPEDLLITGTGYKNM